MRTNEAYPMFQVICPEHGKQPLTEAQYDTQMAAPDSFWFCPICKATSEWDDDSGVSNPPEDDDPHGGADAAGPQTDNHFLQTLRDELRDMGFGNDDQDINGGDFVEYGGQLFEDLEKHLAQPAAAEPAKVDHADALAQWLAVVLDQVDYTAGACQVTELVGAVLDASVIDNARRAIDAYHQKAPV